MKKNKSSLLLLSLVFLTSCGTPSGIDCLTIKPGGDGTQKTYNVIVYCNRKAKDVTIPKMYDGLDVKSVAKNVFKDCEFIENVTFEGKIEDWCNILLYHEYSNPMSYGQNFYLFNENNEVIELNNIETPDSVKRIEQYQFYNFKDIETVKLNSVTNVAKYGFYGCGNTKSIYLGNLARIAQNAFVGCDSAVFYSEQSEAPSGWKDGWIDSDRPVYFGISEDTFVESEGIQYVVENEKATVARYVGLDSTLVIPSTVIIGDKSYDVAKIGEYAFQNCDSLKSVTIPSSVVETAKTAFEGCSATRK